MKKILSLLLALCLLFFCVPCHGEEVNLVASFYPIYIFARNLLEGVPGVSLSCMTSPSTGCLHDYQLLTGDMRLLSRADALLINGAGMEGFLPAVSAQLKDLQVVDASAGISLLCSEEGHQHSHDEEKQHSHGEYNAHIWLSPKNAVRMVQNLADGLAGLLPGEGEKIQANAAAYTARLEAQDRALADALAPYAHREIVTFHDSFPYFAKSYDLHIASVVSLEPNEPLSPRMLTGVIRTITEKGNPPLFAEPQYHSAALDTISRETGAPVFVLDTLATGPDSLTAYEDAMQYNLQVLLEALQP